MEHRWGERIGINLPVQLRGPAGSIASGRIADASVSGAFILTPLEQPAFTRLDVLIDGYAVAAFVVRLAPSGLGIEWCELTPEIISQLLLAHGAPREPAADAIDVPAKADTTHDLQARR